MNAVAVLHFCSTFGGPSDRRRNVKPSTSLPRLQPVENPESYQQVAVQWHFSPVTWFSVVGCGKSWLFSRTLSTSCSTCLLGTSRSACRAVEVNDRARPETAERRD
jgi:hypothetical protein